MKLRYKGGHLVPVLNKRTGQPQIDPKTEKAVLRDELTQTLEETEYHFPSKGAVLSVPSNVGSWLLGKHKAYLEEVPEEASPTESGSPRRLVAVVPSDATAKPADPKPH